MKPQSLQDAIKAAALKKKQKEWKEPVVKQHKITKDDLVVAKKSGVATPAAAPVTAMHMGAVSSAGSGSIGADILRQIERDRAEFRKEKEEWMKQVQNIKQQLSVASSGTSRAVPAAASASPSIEEKKLRSEIEDLQMRVQVLESDKKKNNSGLETLRTKLSALESTNKSLQDDLESTKKQLMKVSSEVASAFTAASAAATAKKPAIVNKTAVSSLSSTSPAVRKAKEKVDGTYLSEGNKSLSSLSSSPKKSKPGTVSSTILKNKGSSSLSKGLSLPAVSNNEDFLQPFSAAIIGKYQGRDEALRKYIINPDVYGAMYHRSEMSTQEIDGTSIVFFKKKLYVPDKLREKCLKYYFATFGEDAQARLTENCIWPTIERDAKEAKAGEDTKRYRSKSASR